MGFDDAGGHAVHPDVALRQLGGQRAGQTHQGRLTHAVCTQALQKRQPPSPTKKNTQKGQNTILQKEASGHLC